MIYEKAKAEIVIFDNSDVITNSGCPGNSNNKGNGQGGGNDCAHNSNNKQYCDHGVNSKTDGKPAEMWDAGWLG